MEKKKKQSFQSIKFHQAKGEDFEPCGGKRQKGIAFWMDCF